MPINTQHIIPQTMKSHRPSRADSGSPPPAQATWKAARLLEPLPIEDRLRIPRVSVTKKTEMRVHRSLQVTHESLCDREGWSGRQRDPGTLDCLPGSRCPFPGIPDFNPYSVSVPDSMVSCLGGQAQNPQRPLFVPLLSAATRRTAAGHRRSLAILDWNQGVATNLEGRSP